ncbi:siphovirus Gp157 family protein [Macrococcus armenti]|uniref:siphovirus Gp157 family protein n=1 Tax=Macrococcus armenti TaxID=2875764 RepID=UPI001CCE9367|nr:siphovirus Gp157 family protein [Macrococcus armenti]UBH21603.1 siphovirus Gp157 family protein [Macrococcus armenti]
MSNLFGISSDLEQVKAMMIDPEYSEVDLKDTLDSLELEFEKKAEGIKYVMLEKKAHIDALKERKKVIDARIKQEERGIESLNRYLYDAMLFTGKTKFKTSEFTFYIKNNAPQIDREKLDVSKVPSEYFIEQEPKLDSKKLLNDLKAGKEIETAELKVTESLVIR